MEKGDFQPANFHTLAIRWWIRLLRIKTCHMTPHPKKTKRCAFKGQTACDRLSLHDALAADSIAAMNQGLEVLKKPKAWNIFKLDVEILKICVVCVTSYHQYSLTFHWMFLHASLTILWCLRLVTSSGPSFCKKKAKNPKTEPLHPAKLVEKHVFFPQPPPPPPSSCQAHSPFLVGENGRQEANLERFELVSQQ